MKAREHDPRRLDVEAFAREAATLEGRWPVEELARLAASMHAEAPAGAADAVRWRVRGESRARRGAPAEVWLHLEGEAEVALECQRCLQPVRVPLTFARSFLFVSGEATAAELDADSEDDVLALTRALDLQELVEDELLLTLPLVPRHAQCPAPLALPDDPAPAAEEPETPHPFAALAALKPPSRRH